MSEQTLTRSLWPEKKPLDPIDAQLARLLDGLRPGQARERYAGWGREMRSLYGRLDPLVLRGAVTRCLALETDLPRPAAFAPYVVLAEEALERKKRAEATEKLPAPPPPTEAELREAQQRAEAAKEEARSRLPPHLRKPRPRR